MLWNLDCYQLHQYGVRADIYLVLHHLMSHYTYCHSWWFRDVRDRNSEQREVENLLSAAVLFLVSRLFRSGFVVEVRFSLVSTHRALSRECPDTCTRMLWRHRYTVFGHFHNTVSKNIGRKCERKRDCKGISVNISNFVTVESRMMMMMMERVPMLQQHFSGWMAWFW